jgi:hypothetical protein
VSPMRLIGAIVLPVLQALSTMPLEMIMAEQVRDTQVQIITSLLEIILLCATVYYCVCCGVLLCGVCCEYSTITTLHMLCQMSHITFYPHVTALL